MNDEGNEGIEEDLSHFLVTCQSTVTITTYSENLSSYELKITKNTNNLSKLKSENIVKTSLDVRVRAIEQESTIIIIIIHCK